MKARIVLVLCVVLVASLLALGTRANVQKSRTTWEYKVLVNSWDQKQLDGLGVEGWELVAIDHESGTGQVWAFFKRPK